MAKGNRYSGIGGQAVLEGVMMKNQDKYAVAVRKPNGEIEVEIDEYKGMAAGASWSKLPLIRGVFAFVDSMVLGMKTLTWSASFYEEEEEEKEQSKFEKKLGDKADRIMMGFTVAISIILAVGLFMLLPFFISDLCAKVIRNATVVALLEGVIRIAIFLGYVLIISLMKDIRRVYMYHGAEHKCINCIEKGRPLTVKDVRRSSRQHKRCGTSFLLFVVVVSVIVFFFIRVDNLALKLLLRILLIPIIAGISYEIIRLAGKSNHFLVRIISAPGMLLQKLTTREPDDDMIEVAIASVEAIFDWKAYLKETFGYDVDDSWLEDTSHADDTEDLDETDMEPSGTVQES